MTCNVNGIRAAVRKGFWQWAARQRADVICLQELRADLEQIPNELCGSRGYHAYFQPAERKGYSGVAILSKKPAKRVVNEIGDDLIDSEGRFLEAEFDRVTVSSIYFPSGTSGDHRQGIKYEFLDKLEPEFRRRRGKPHVTCGDFNIAHREIDLKNWRGNRNHSGFLPEERAWLDKLFDEIGFVDAFREVNPGEDQYTWWSNRGQAYAKNVGWRIDYHVVSPVLRGRARKARIYKSKRFSDHAPLTIDYDYDF